MKRCPLSPSTEQEDLGRFYGESDRIPDNSPEAADVTQHDANPKPPGKLAVYEQYLRVPHYLVYSRYTKCLRYFKLMGTHYEEQPVQAETPMVWFHDLKLGLGMWEGYFESLPGPWLRWCDADGTWYLTDTEKAEAEKAKAEAEKAQAVQQAERLARRLKELGIDPDLI